MSAEQPSQSFIAGVARRVFLQMLDSKAFQGSVASIVIGLITDWVVNAGRATADVIALAGDELRFALAQFGWGIVNPFAVIGGDLLSWMSRQPANAAEFAGSFGPLAPFVAIVIVALAIGVLVILVALLVEGLKWLT